MTLPPAARAYFEADSDRDGEALLRAFAPDAIVRDEGQIHAGHQAIGAWWRETKDKYQTLLEPLEVDSEGRNTAVRARVTGQFPGSPAMLNFRFRLDGERISRLDIEG